MQNLLSQKQAWERFGRMLDNLEKRLERTNEIQEQAEKFTQKALKEFNGEIAAHHDEMSDREHSQVNGGEPIFYKGKNITALGGGSPAEKTKLIAQALFSGEELVKIVIDPQKTLKPGAERQPADAERTILYKKAVQVVLGENYNEDVYRRTLKLVNQSSIDKKNKASKRKLDNNEI